MKRAVTTILFFIFTVGCGSSPLVEDPSMTQRSRLLKPIHKKPYQLAGQQLNRYLQNRPNKSATLPDLLKVVEDASLPIATRLAAKVATENFDAFETAASAKDGKFTISDADAISKNEWEPKDLNPRSISALVGELLLENFSALDTSGDGLLYTFELRDIGRGQSDLATTADIGADILHHFDTQSGNTRPDGKIGMADLEVVISRAVADFPNTGVRSAVKNALVRVEHWAGDPGSIHVNLRFEWDDARFRHIFPNANGLEEVYADIPGLGTQRLSFDKTKDGVDLYWFHRELQPSDPRAPEVEKGDVHFTVVSNAGTFEQIATALETDRDVRSPSF